MVSVFQWIAFALYVALALALAGKYLRTRDAGFVWLGVALILWPLAAYWLNQGEGVLIDRVLHGQAPGFYPFSLIATGQLTVGELVSLTRSVQQLIGVGLLLVAVLYLSRAKRPPDLQPAA
jgi:hypothetical protein